MTMKPDVSAILKYPEGNKTAHRHEISRMRIVFMDKRSLSGFITLPYKKFFRCTIDAPIPL